MVIFSILTGSTRKASVEFDSKSGTLKVWSAASRSIVHEARAPDIGVTEDRNIPGECSLYSMTGEEGVIAKSLSLIHI